ncbi:RsmB/NOP family class I SAM-dependent RNA methyltransferase [Maridesulfovibrio ferrireducens]|uniref:RsmB/NOP family class I SAM-dependent RNA methyltransferase n=1 Tax=Maridesulfovibrio ferrireducens TaxID=246191 RepID=UPI001A2A8584|nr:RsmB/NOP family class I SAM-dependent RNA methyltransferase [Maridesulfovibrio ferrireducens]MBI9110726.1 RsmB/NOP family class I SAM-dependent RNA methyltransferase [Maridesulfovibrio ferrireducens]
MTNNLRTFRLVCSEKDIPAVEELLRSQGFEFSPEPFYSMARRLEKEPFPLGDSLASRFGRIYIQDRSSMLPPLMLNPPKGAKVLDMCASPGSKTGILARLVGRDGFVLASEPSKDRLALLRQNLRRVQAINSATVSYESQKIPLPSNGWEYILLDPPCSGWGTINKNPKAMDLWSGEKTLPLIALQRQLLAKAFDLLTPGGNVVYSTCTTNVQENEEQTRFAVEELGFELVKLPHPAGFTIAEPLLPNMDGVLRVDGSGGGQGFYVCGLRKPGNAEPEYPETAPLPGQKLNLKKQDYPEAIDFSALPDGELYDFKGKAMFLNRHALNMLPPNLRWQGYPLGKISGKKFRPNPFARTLLPETPAESALVLENAEDLAKLFSGQSLTAPAKGKGPVGLYFKQLLLGFTGKKGSRFIWTEK